MLCLPIPLVIQAKVPLKRLVLNLQPWILMLTSYRKLALVGVFSLGSLVVSSTLGARFP